MSAEARRPALDAAPLAILRTAVDEFRPLSVYRDKAVFDPERRGRAGILFLSLDGRPIGWGAILNSKKQADYVFIERYEVPTSVPEALAQRLTLAAPDIVSIIPDSDAQDAIEWLRRSELFEPHSAELRDTDQLDRTAVRVLLEAYSFHKFTGNSLPELHMEHLLAAFISTGQISNELLDQEKVLTSLHRSLSGAAQSTFSTSPIKRELELPRVFPRVSGHVAEAFDVASLIAYRRDRDGSKITASDLYEGWRAIEHCSVVQFWLTYGLDPQEQRQGRRQAWLCQYVPEKKREDWKDDAIPGAVLEWWTRKDALPSAVKVDDPIVYWRTKNPNNANDRGGIVGTGTISSIELTLGVNGRYFFKTTVQEFFEDKIIPRDEVVDAAGIKRKNWQGTILALEDEEAERINQLLVARGHQPLFPADEEIETQFLTDDAEVERDELGRGILAISLARRIHTIWCSTNHAWPQKIERSSASADREVDSYSWTGMHDDASPRRPASDSRTGFVVHIDALWGGGKTTFVNFLSRVLNPTGFSQGDDSFLKQRYPGADLRTIFLDEPGGSKVTNYPEDARRPWIIVPFNAWQVEHVTPPWWVFYQTIRRHCFSAIATEGREAVPIGPDQGTGPPTEADRYKMLFGLWCPELWWRLTSPKIMILLNTAVASLLIIFALYALGLVVETEAQGGGTPNYSLGGAIGVVLALLAFSGSLIWTIATLFTESLVPGADSVAERLSMGSGDPFERFRRHFVETMERIRRPVLVIIDDLDRCKPAFIVDLIRGMQTLLRSPRVMFVILGDREWIERAFESHHETMSKVTVGPEQSFGARFVEKAVQLSLSLPDMPREQQIEYVRWLLTGARGGSPHPVSPKVDPETASKLRQVIEQSARSQQRALLETKQIKDDVRAAYASMRSAQPGVDDAERAGDEGRVQRFVNEELAIRAATDEKIEREISHRLEPLAPYFPANPRQIKRIINAVTVYHTIAVQQIGLSPSEPRWFQLALWIVIMTEWPKTWRLLATCPRLVDVVRASKPSEEIAKINAAELPGSAQDTAKAIERIRASKELMALIAGAGNRKGPVLDSKVVEELMVLTPLNNRSVRLDESKSAKEKKDRAEKE